MRKMKFNKNITILETEDEVRTKVNTEIYMASYWLRTTNKKMYEIDVEAEIYITDILKYWSKENVYLYKCPSSDKILKTYIVTLNNRGRFYFRRYEWINNNIKGLLRYFLFGMHYGYSVNKILKFVWKNIKL